MSIGWSLQRLFDPGFVEEDQERHAHTETVPVDPDKQKVRRARQQAEVAPARRYVCRVCDAQQGDGAYCASCLADTMVLLKL